MATCSKARSSLKTILTCQKNELIHKKWQVLNPWILANKFKFEKQGQICESYSTDVRVKQCTNYLAAMTENILAVSQKARIGG